MPWLSLHKALDNSLDNLFSIIKDLRLILADKRMKKGMFRQRTFSVLGEDLFIVYVFIIGDITAEFNILSKLMQRLEVER